MREVTRTRLPGIGLRHEFSTARGERVAVVERRDGRRELAVYERDDPDRCSTALHLDEDDAATLASVLGAPLVSETVAAMQEIEGLAIDWIPVGAAFDGETIADGAFRTRTGASIVAVLRASDATIAPEPTHRLRAGDMVVAVGTADGVGRLRDVLAS